MSMMRQQGFVVLMLLTPRVDSDSFQADPRQIDGSAWIAWRLFFGRGPWRQGSRPLRGGEAALDAMVRAQNLVAHAIQALLQTSRCQHSSEETRRLRPAASGERENRLSIQL